MIFICINKLSGQIKTVEEDGDKAGLIGDMEVSVGCFHNPEQG